MNKPRFIEEYARYKVRELNANVNISREIKHRKICEITNYTSLIERGYLTIDEAMKLLSEV